MIDILAIDFQCGTTSYIAGATGQLLQFFLQKYLQDIKILPCIKLTKILRNDLMQW